MTTANQTQLVVINQLQPIFVKFTVPEKYLAAITAAQQVAPLQVTVNIADPVITINDGVLTFIDNTVDLSSGVVQLKAQFPNPTRQLWPGQFVRVTIKLGEQPNAIVVPSEAVMDGQNGTYVFVAKDDMTVEARPVVRDRAIGNFAVITQGLAADETVVIDGQSKIMCMEKCDYFLKTMHLEAKTMYRKPSLPMTIDDFILPLKHPQTIV